MHEVISTVVDDGEFLEVFPLWAMNIVIGFARLDGRTVGIVGNQPKVLAGTLDIDASEKAAPLRPVLRRVQHPARHVRGRPGLPARHRRRSTAGSSGTARSSCTRSRGHRAADDGHPAQGVRRRVHRHELQAPRAADVSFAWPTAEIAVMGAEGAVNVVFRRQIEKSPNPDEKRAELITEYQEKFSTPYASAERGFVDDVIEPAETRPRLIKALRMLSTKREAVPAVLNAPRCRGQGHSEHAPLARLQRHHPRCSPKYLPRPSQDSSLMGPRPRERSLCAGRSRSLSSFGPATGSR